jgi:hypothetical protein
MPCCGSAGSRHAAWSLGSIDAAKAVETERRYVVTFFERWL